MAWTVAPHMTALSANVMSCHVSYTTSQAEAIAEPNAVFSWQMDTQHRDDSVSRTML